MKKFILTLIIIIFAWAIGLRVVEVLNGNYLFGFDQGRDYLAAYNIAVGHKFTLIGAEVGAGAAGLSHLFHGPGYYYLIALMELIFRGDPYGGLLLMFLFGVLALFAVYMTVRKMFGRAVSLAALLLVGISPLIVTQSRFMWNHHPSTLFIVLALYFAYMITKKPRIYAPLAVFAAGIIYHFELAIAVPFVIALVLALPLVFRIKDIRTYVYSAVAGVTAFFPFLLFESRHGWMAIRSLITYTTPHGPVGKDVWFLRITDHMRPYIASAANSFPSEHGLLPFFLYQALALMLVIVLIVLAVKLKDTVQRNFFRFALLLMAATYGVMLLLENMIWDYYLIHLHIIFIYIFAYSLVRSYRSRYAFGVLCIFLLSMIVASAWRMKISYTYDLHDFGGVEKIKGKKAAIDYVYHDAAGKPFSEFTFMAPIYTYPYDYLFATYGKEKYRYAPGTQKKGLVYLIIEPDASKPWTYKGWLETVIAGGDVINTATISAGQIIQKRIFPL